MRTMHLDSIISEGVIFIDEFVAKDEKSPFQYMLRPLLSCARALVVASNSVMSTFFPM